MSDDDRLRDALILTPPNARQIGSVLDPGTGELVDVYAAPLHNHLPYRKSDGTFGNMRSMESDAAWPDGGLWSIYTSNGRMFGENYFDREGWWVRTDVRYLPIARNRGRAYRLLVDLIEGANNGFPWRDVIAYATGWSFRNPSKITKRKEAS